jgi:hypothetical protein
MSFTLDRLKSAFEQINQLDVMREFTFPVLDTSITLRVITPEEETAAQKEAYLTSLKDKNVDGVTAAEFAERFKMGILSHAIVGIADEYIPDFVETGETLDNGVTVKVPRHKAIKDLLLQWSGVTRTRVFVKYGEMLIKYEKSVEKEITFDPVDIDSEIERLENRILELKEEKERLSADTKERLFTQHVKSIMSEDRSEPVMPEETVAAVPEPPQQQQPRKPITPTMAPAPETVAPQTVRHPVNRTPEPPVNSFDDIPDSFMSSDGDMEEQLRAEEQRILAMRRGQAQSPSVIKRPPHLAAAETNQQVYQDKTSFTAKEEISKPMPPKGTVQINSQVQGTVNPRFRGPRNK